MLPGSALHLHHVGYVVKTIDSIAKTYVDRYGYELSTPVIHDPLQTAFVQFLKLAGDQTFLEFVSPDSPESKLVSASKRGGLNHLCFTADNLEQTIVQLEESGMRLISEPKPGRAFGGRRICWLVGEDPLPIELVEKLSENDLCVPLAPVDHEVNSFES
ncbi:VOC family protein [Tunturiibacter gelidoferens]|uniref:Methylmalonyl-CoA/ethylmalonyl-CoA epimerase n=1 Tax=Tunturiibacter lichenicola TaxID=2051959 RepID=A0A7Y9NJN8_9BACT|nr:VOC family protein [Edaphobacter lichenicola]NYF50554.1 methylmalonyl-CoA/ethylmalonyl-CoA epimerase [Edaphobacter lichenicola]